MLRPRATRLSLSPTGTLAYGSNDLGDDVEVAVRPFRGQGATVQVSSRGGAAPVWSRDGAELFYRGRDGDGESWIMAVPVSTSGERFEVGNPVKLFKDVYLGSHPLRNWDVLSDGRFLFLKVLDDDAQPDRVHEIMPDRIQFVLNWASSLD